MADHVQTHKGIDHDRYVEAGNREGRVIGLEVRLRDPITGALEEIGVIPVDVRYLSNGGPPVGLSITAHCADGDANFPGEAQLPTPRYRGVR
jgi:hypothetical protein